MKKLFLVLLFAGSVSAAEPIAVAMSCKGVTNDGRPVVLNLPRLSDFKSYVTESTAWSTLTIGDVQFRDSLNYPRYQVRKNFVPENTVTQIFSAAAKTDIYLCSWKKCALRQEYLYIESIDGKTGAGFFKFRIKENGKKRDYSINLTCELSN